MWLLDDYQDMETKELVQEEGDEEPEVAVVQPSRGRRKRWEAEAATGETEGEEGVEALRDKLSLLRETLGQVRDQMTRLEFEAELLKDEKLEREEEMRLQRSERVKLVEVCSVLKEARAGDQERIAALQQQLSELRALAGGMEGED